MKADDRRYVYISRGGDLNVEEAWKRCRNDLLEVGIQRHWAAGSVLMHEGERSEHVVIIEAGRVKVTSAAAASGKQALLAIRGPGDLIGEFSAIDGRARSATVTALASVTATSVSASAFRDLLVSDGKIAFTLLQVVVERLREADVQRLEFGAYSVTERVARLLVDYARRYGERGDDRVIIALALSQEELAHAAGASREAVSKALKRLRDLGAVRTGRRRVELLRPDLLADIVKGLPSVHLDADAAGHLR
ncbi:Crp/Fnr family transcriptional regulator [Nocardia sp. GTS18]|uniref:Crp/Fnr family transcriptional regulator n=1 Tax=Nocardia sp. GTS18 TaxID=1778064 RepID=UPI0015EFDA2B|nr:Crp/Fnr family transcriptional regulator [Nocardia sp. GTS18]